MLDNPQNNSTFIANSHKIARQTACMRFAGGLSLCSFCWRVMRS